ncbi:MAG: polysaccharide export protein [Bacteroidales bacterium]|nr:polysaccharide export protein [Bacteroidales bacterium]
MTSCVPRKKLLYLQPDENDTIAKTYFEDNITDYKIQPGDNLNINITSFDSESSKYFETGAATANYDASIYLNSYSVSDSGFISLPFLGNIEVAGHSVIEASEIVTAKIKKYIRDASVRIKLVNYIISVLGEVNRPDQYKIYQDQITIFEVLGLAGDITPYGDRNDVMLVRKTMEGSQIFTLDLQDRNLLASEFYFVKPDDIIYVKPVKGKNFLFTSFPYTLVFGIITTILLIMTFVKN